MYAGKLVELAHKKELFDNPLHPYTKALLTAIPIPDPKKKRQVITLKGEVPSLLNPPPGCRFHERCSDCKSSCRETDPQLEEVSKNHFVACC
jgi:oligopeptide/dipeptide ABC transporter ATP-binding protein